MTPIQIATTIFDQIRAGVPLPVLWSWGLTGKKAVNHNQIPLTDNNGKEYPPYLGGLLFHVNGRIHAGHVLIALDYSDTYIIYLGKLIKGKFEVLGYRDNVYCEELGTSIDELIEKQPHYQF